MVTWRRARQSLADFEARPVTELARQYDVMIIDRPGLGAAIAAGAIQPLRRLVPREVMAEWKATSFVPTWDSYVVGGQPWALPVDAATQVSVYRPDLLPAAPRGWAEVPALARERRGALCLGGPHAFLAVLAMCAPGEPPLPTARDLLRADSAVTAIELLRAIWRVADKEVSAGDPIAVHEAMAASADLACCPLAYGYASYARPAPGRHALRWADAPRSLRADRPGTVLGGTGLAVSAVSGLAQSRSGNHGPDADEVLAFLTAFWTAEVQAGLVPAHAGQSAALLLLTGDPVDAAEALRIGLVSRVYSPDSLVAAARSLASVIASRPPVAAQAAKANLLAARSMGLEQAIQYEREMQAICMGTRDAAEGRSAFAEKRPPSSPVTEISWR